MRILLHLSALVASFVVSAAVLLWIPEVIRLLPVRGPHWPETPIKNLSYGEWGAWMVLVLALVFGLGFALGKLFGPRMCGTIAVGAGGPALVFWFLCMVVSMGLAIFAFPVPIAYVTAAYLGAKRDGRSPLQRAA